SEHELSNVRAYSDIFDCVYIVDNSDRPNMDNNIFSEIENVEFIHRGTNIGLSDALNLMCFKAADSFDYICLLDQDSVFGNDKINLMMGGINKHEDNLTAIYAPRIIYAHNNNNEFKPVKGFDDVDWVITSGSFLNLHAFKVIGPFDKAYFIDRLDFDYCYFARLHGYNIKVSNEVCLFQTLGASVSFFGFKHYQHSPLRNYYSFRNRIYFYLRRECNKNYIYKIIKLFALSCKHILSIIVVEDNKIEKLKFIYLAINDYLSHRMGKYK
ncbi:MAG: glycosyltransferase, partial [Plesiomonas shigelloides]